MRVTALIAIFGLSCGSDAPPGDAVDHPHGGDVLTGCPISFDDHDRACDFEGFCSESPQHCCGITSQGSGCGCEDGKVICVIDDTCLFTQCLPGCGPNQFTTSRGCTECQAIPELVSERLQALATELGACHGAGDCALVGAELRCGTYCGFAVASDNREAFDQRADAIGQQDCPLDAHGGCLSGGLCTPAVAAICVDGQCQPRGGCDPSHVPVDPQCDDRNACTSDTCDATLGCRHDPSSDACASDDPCSVGGVCADGACTDSPVRGFTRTVPNANTMTTAVAADTDGAIYVTATHLEGAELPASRILVLDTHGALQRTITLSRAVFAKDLRVLPSGLLVAGEVYAGDDSDVFVGLFDTNGTQVWGHVIAAPKYDQMPRLALAGDRVAVAWHHGDIGAEGEAMLALTDVAGTVPHVISLGASSAYYDFWADGFVRVTGAAADADASGAFITARPRTGAGDYLHTEVVVTRVASDSGALLGEFVLPAEELQFPRGVLALPGGDLILWGIRSNVEHWLRRVTPTGTVVWQDWTGAEDVALEDGALNVLGNDSYVVGARQYLDGAAWLARFDRDGARLSSLPMSRGPRAFATAPVTHGFIVVGNVASGVPVADDSEIWVRRASTSAPECAPR